MNLVKRFRISYSKRIQYNCFRKSALNPLSFLNTLWIHYRFCELTNNPLSIPKLTIDSLFFPNSTNMTTSSLNQLWIHYLFRKVIMNPQSISKIHYWYTINALSVSPIHIIFSWINCASIVFFLNSFWALIHNSFAIS